jgi:small GTP-binding protein
MREQGVAKREHDFLAKILVIGDGGVGKTSLITRFTEERFQESYTATIGVDFRSRIIRCEERQVKLQIWDTAGQERFRNITQAYYRGASGILLAFALNDPHSFHNIEKWIHQIDDNAPRDCSKLLVGSKSDILADRAVSSRDAEKLAAKMGVAYLETSARTGQNVEEAFSHLGKLIYENSLRKVAKSEDKIRLGSHHFQEDKSHCRC